MSTTKNLGFVKAIHEGLSPPSNTSMLWYDTNVNLHKYYNTTSSMWVPLIVVPDGSEYYGIASGTNNYTATISNPSGISSHLAGYLYKIKFSNPNTGPSTIDINSIGSKDILYNNNPLNGGEISADTIHLLVYDGFIFHLINSAIGNDFDGVYYHIVAGQKVTVGDRKQYIVKGSIINNGTLQVNGSGQLIIL